VLRLNLLLFLVLLGCAISVVSARHKARDLFVELQKEETGSRDLDIEWGRLLLEQSTWAMHTRVEVVARNQLQMSVPDPSSIYLLRLPEGPRP
jgi:cell division protein FtsL